LHLVGLLFPRVIVNFLHEGDNKDNNNNNNNNNSTLFKVADNGICIVRFPPCDRDRRLNRIQQLYYYCILPKDSIIRTGPVAIECSAVGNLTLLDVLGL
jgi:hypothetical protein